MIMPADSPSIAVISGHGTTIRFENNRFETTSAPRLRLHCNYETLIELESSEITAPGGIQIEFAEWPSQLLVRPLKSEFIITRMEGGSSWTEGRAGMQYRDLIPGHLGGSFIASHIRIPEGGETRDYVHFHRVLFQMIYCKAGWARLVYEGQGPPFIMNAGDCVLQPPEIRHRVLETSAGFEVIEIGCPAIHETFVDHVLQLPTVEYRPERLYERQRFLHHIASGAVWDGNAIKGFGVRDTSMFSATKGLAKVRVLRGASTSFSFKNTGDFLFYSVLEGDGYLSGKEIGEHTLKQGDACVIPASAEFTVGTKADVQILEVNIENLL